MSGECRGNLFGYTGQAEDTTCRSSLMRKLKLDKDIDKIRRGDEDLWMKLERRPNAPNPGVAPELEAIPFENMTDGSHNYLAAAFATLSVLVFSAFDRLISSISVMQSRAETSSYFVHTEGSVLNAAL